MKLAPLLLLFVLNSLFFCVSNGAKEGTLTRAIHFTEYEQSDIAIEVLIRTREPQKNGASDSSPSTSASSSSYENMTCFDDPSLCSGRMGTCCTYDEIQGHVKPEEYGQFEDVWTCMQSNYTCCPASDGRLKGCPPDHSTCCIWGSSLKTLSFGCCNGGCSNKAGWCNEGRVDSGASSLKTTFTALFYMLFLH